MLHLGQGTTLLAAGIGYDFTILIHAANDVVAGIGDVYSALIVYRQTCGGIEGGLLSGVVAEAGLAGASRGVGF